MKKLLLLLTFVACLTAQAASTFSVTNYNNVFTITRSSSTTAETVYYRTVGIDAISTIHYLPAIGKLNFAVGETSKTVTVEEIDVTTIPAFCRFQSGLARRYRFELLDKGGFVLALAYRDIYYGNDYNCGAAFVSPHIEDLVYLNQYVTVGHACQLESGMPSSTYVDAFFDGTREIILIYDEETYLTPYSVSTDKVYNSQNPDGLREYFSAIHDKLYATIYFEETEISYGSYQYIQILADNETTYDGKDPDGNVNTPSKSLYKACFELRAGDAGIHSGQYQFFPHRYDYYNQAEGNQPATHTEFTYADSRFYAQKFRDNSLRAAEAGALVLDPSVKTLTVRFDANGKDEDTWGFRLMNARLALCDDVAPTLADMQITSGPYAKGTPFAVTLIFSEAVKASNAVLHTNWGNLTWQGSGGRTNAVTFMGTIDADVVQGTPLSVIGYDGVIKDLVGNEFTGSVQRTFNATVAQSYNYKITYDLNGGVATGYNPTSYNYETNTFTLRNPEREGYNFIGWTGSNGNTPQTTVTITQGSHGDLNFVANWAPALKTGDLNGDGNVDVSDVSILIDVVLGKEVTLASGVNTDLNGDGNTDVTDVSLLIDIVLGKYE